MKIFQFTPNPLVNKVSSPIKTECKTAKETDFASILKSASSWPSSNSGGVISMENQRALQLPPLSDLGQAGRLLDRLRRNIRSSTPGVLNSHHNLGGLVYVYSKS